MRSMDIKIGDLELSLAMHFDAASELSRKVYDLMGVVREAQIEARMAEVGLSYRPAWQATTENIPLIFYIGAKYNAPSLTLAQVQGAVFEHGFPEAQALAMEYLAALVTPTARKKAEGKGDAKPGE